MNTEENTSAPAEAAADAQALAADAPKVPAKFKATVDADLWKNASGLIKRVINRKSCNIITQLARLFVHEGLLMLSVTDLEQSCTAPIGSADGEGACLLEPAKLDGVSKLEVDGLKITLIGKSRRQVAGSDPEEFPKIEQAKWDYHLDCHIASFVAGLTAALSSVALEKGRYALNGVLFEPAKTALELCGTDGRRLSYAKLPCKSNVIAKDAAKRRLRPHDPPYQVIVPVNACLFVLQYLKRVPHEPTVDVPNPAFRLGVTENRIGFTHGGVSYQSLLVEGQFPDYRTVIPQDVDVKLIVEREPLIEALIEAKKCTSVESTAVKFTGVPDGLELKSRSPVNGEATVHVPLQTVPPPYSVALDPEYVLRALAGFPGRYVQIDFKDYETGVIIHDGDVAKHFELVMPIDFDAEPTLRQKPQPLDPANLTGEKVMDENTRQWRPITAGEIEKRVKERTEDIARWEAEKLAFPDVEHAWRVSHRKIEPVRNGGRDIGELLVSRDDVVTPLNIGLVNLHARARKPARKSKVTAHDLNKPGTTTGVKPGRPDPAAEVTIEEQLETPQALGYRLDDKQWKLW